MGSHLSKYWWVNHKQTFKHEIEGGFLWSPKLKSNGDRNYFYDTMIDAQLGDFVFSYAGAKISYFGIVVEEASTALKPAEFGSAGDDWNNEGWLLPIAWRVPFGLYLQCYR
jgi:putative restriction endonuclease